MNGVCAAEQIDHTQPGALTADILGGAKIGFRADLSPKAN
jgi:hypothetical protein